jgi:hypothetical protein
MAVTWCSSDQGSQATRDRYGCPKAGARLTPQTFMVGALAQEAKAG